MVVAKGLKLISNHSRIISGTYFSSFHGSLTQTGAQEGSETMFWLLFFLILNDFPQIPLNESFYWIFLPILNWMIIFYINILDFVLHWIIFRPDSMKIWIFKKDRPPPKSSPIMTLLQSNIFPHKITSSSQSIIVGSATTFVWQHFVSQHCEIDFSNCTTYVWQYLKLFHSVS